LGITINESSITRLERAPIYGNRIEMALDEVKRL